MSICQHCNMDIAIRNPSGFCDHLYYPENCKECLNITTKPKDDGGPAFPTFKKSFRDCNGTAVEIREYKTTSGLSLRDWFAGMALQGILSNPELNGQWNCENEDLAINNSAKAAYLLADTMLAERNKNEQAD